MSDQLLKFLFHRAPVRGEVVRLEQAWQRMVQFHHYPAPVTQLLGEMTAAAALLAANIKFSGTLELQIQGDGPVRLLVVECRPDLPDLNLRATAKLRDAAAIPAEATLAQLVDVHGNGRCAITLDPRERGQQPYQGIVSLHGNSIAQALENYMRQSEQLDTRLWLAADARVASGVLLQKLPQDGGKAASSPQAQDDDAWGRAAMLASTLSAAELLATPPETLVRRLFWQEQLQHAPPLAPRFACTCSRERIGRMLLSLGRGEVNSIVAEQGRVEVTCDFCNAKQAFDAVDIGQLFATGSTDEAAVDRPH